MRLSAPAALAAVVLAAAAAGAGEAKKTPLTLDQIAEMAKSEGLRGRVHAANHKLGAYVFTWSRPGNFFESLNLSMVPGNAEVRSKLGALERHQEALVRGTIRQQYGSQPHVVVESLEAGEKWSPGVTALPGPAPPADLEKALSGRSRLAAMVHAISEDGAMLAVEWRDAVLPVQVPETPELRKAVAGLYRGDRIRFRFRIAPHPKQPLHLALDPEGAGERGPLEVTDALHDQHGRERAIEGRLVLFPKSPVLRRAVWAVEEKGDNGLHRYFTIFNFDDLKDQDRTDARLSAAWHSGEALDGRNKYIHTRVRVRVSGKVSNPARNQANPTLVTPSDRVEVLEGKSSR